MGAPGFSGLAGKVVLVTGGARGQGAAEATLFAKLDAHVVVTDVLEEDGRALAEHLGERAEFLPQDVGDEVSWRCVVESVVARHGRIDVLVNNAGIYRRAPLTEWSADDLRSVVGINLIGPLLGMRAVAPVMPPGSSIVNVASTAALAGFGPSVPYASSKWGLRGASRSAARELAPSGIRVNCVCPGSVDTPMIDAAKLDLSHLPIPRPGSADEVATMVAFLASDASSYCTGADFVVDGGATA